MVTGIRQVWGWYEVGRWLPIHHFEVYLRCMRSQLCGQFETRILVMTEAPAVGI